MSSEEEKGKVGERSGEFHLVYAYGIICTLIGLLLIFSSTHTESEMVQMTSGFQTFYEFLSHVGVAFFVLGMVGIMIEFRDWKKYFQSRLADVVTEQSYLNKLKDGELIELQTNSLKAYFKNMDIDREGSFLQYFFSRIHTYIGDPFREDLHSLKQITKTNDPNIVSVKQVASYKCRKSGGEKGTIQKRLYASYEHNEFIKRPNVSIILQCPSELKGKCVITNCKYKEHCGEEISVPGTDIKSDSQNSKEYEFIYDLKDFLHVDGLFVRMETIGEAEVHRQLISGVTYPAHRATFTIHFPEDWDISAHILGMRLEDCKIEQHPGLYSVFIEQWILPDCGITVQTFERKQIMLSQ